MKKKKRTSAMGHGASCMGWREGGVDAGRLRGRGWSVLNDEEDEEDEEEDGGDNGRCREVRVAVVGDTGVGKTAFVRRFVKGDSDEDDGNRNINNNSSTIGVECQTKVVRQDGRAYRVAVVDCGGRRKYEGLAQGFLARCDVALVAFDAARADTLDGAAAWVRTWKRSKFFADCPWVLVGLEHDSVRQEVADARAQQLADAEGACCVLCASVCARSSVGAVFAEALRIVEDCRAHSNNDNDDNSKVSW